MKGRQELYGGRSREHLYSRVHRAPFFGLDDITVEWSQLFESSCILRLRLKDEEGILAVFVQVLPTRRRFPFFSLAFCLLCHHGYSRAYCWASRFKVGDYHSPSLQVRAEQVLTHVQNHTALDCFMIRWYRSSKEPDRVFFPSRLDPWPPGCSEWKRGTEIVISTIKCSTGRAEASRDPGAGMYRKSV